MANNIYRIDLLTVNGSVTVTDDGTGVDWLEIRGSYSDPTDIRLNYSNAFPASIDATGLFYTPGVTHRLIVNGLIENVRGCDSADYIIGNEANNRLYGDQDNGKGGNDTLSGGDGNDSLYGGNANDSLLGGNGNDLMLGGTGNDTISGGDGRDTIEGGAGADSLSGGAQAGDTVSYAGSSAAVRIDISSGLVTTGIGGDAAGDQISSFLNVIGSNHNDILTDMRKGTIAFGYNDNNFSGGRGADQLVMGGGNDTASGGSGNDSLFGEDGKDKLIGGLGADLLSGGSAADRFIFGSAADSTANAAGRDTISDFSRSQGDRIDISSLDADLASTATNEAFTFRSAVQGFTGNGAEVTFVSVAGGIKVMADNNADGVADFSIFLQGVATVSAGDFAL